MPAILLSTLNARYFHSALGLRYLYANLGELQADAVLREFIITQRPLDIAEALLAEQPCIVGFGIYLWNVVETAQVIALLKRVRPELIVVLGGPEVSHEWEEQPIVELADYVITGPADLAFAQLCRRLLSDDQQIVDEGDGRARASATVNDTALLRWWLLGFGSGVEVLEPAACVRKWPKPPGGWRGVTRKHGRGPMLIVEPLPADSCHRR